MNPMNPDLEALFNRAVDGIASEADQHELSELLRSSSEARSAYREFIALHTSLHWDYVATAAPETGAPKPAAPEPAQPEPAQPEPVGTDTAGTDTPVGTDTPARRASEGVSSNPSLARRTPSLARRAGVVFAGALALSLLIVVGWFAVTQYGAKPEVVAVLDSADGARWEATSLAAGDELHAGQKMKLAAGIAEIRFASGAAVVLQGPATLQLDSAQQVSLHDGALSAVVPPQAVGFTVHAPGLKVVDLGTRFGLKTRRGHEAELHVFQGRAQASLVDGGGQSLQTVTLGKLEAAVIDPTQQTIARAESVLESFLFDDSLQHEFGRIIVQAEQFTGRSKQQPDGGCWSTFQPPHDSFKTASGNQFTQAVRDDLPEPEEPGRGNVPVPSAGGPTAYAAFEGPWLSYDFEIRETGRYQLWLLAAGHGDGPDGRADYVEAVIKEYRNAAYRGSSALRPRAMNLNALVGMWQIGEEVPSPGSVTPFVIGSRLVNQPVPEGATRLFLGCHDFQEWSDNSGRVTANVVWSAEGSDDFKQEQLTVDSDDCLSFAWATTEELGLETAGRGPHGEHSSSRPQSLSVPSTAQRMTITAEGIWSHIAQDELIGRLAIKLYRLDDAGDTVELFSAKDVLLPHGRVFQWTRVGLGGEPTSLSAGSYRLRIHAQRPGSAIDAWLLQPASLPDPIAR